MFTVCVHLAIIQLDIYLSVPALAEKSNLIERMCTPMGKFVVKNAKNGGFVFNLKAGNGEVIATSEVYTTEQGCLNGIESVKKNAVDAKIEKI